MRAPPAADKASILLGQRSKNPSKRTRAGFFGYRNPFASQRGRVEKLSFPSEAEEQNDDFLARAEQRRFFGSFLASKRNIPTQSFGTNRPAAKGALGITTPSNKQKPLPPGVFPTGSEGVRGLYWRQRSAVKGRSFSAAGHITRRRSAIRCRCSAATPGQGRAGSFLSALSPALPQAAEVGMRTVYSM